MQVLDELSGFEFEDVMEDVFRNLGYQNVRQTSRTGDEGRDILMEEHIDGGVRGVVVECKHQDVVGRGVVQKLHSAVSTYDFDGAKRGLVATTGRVTEPAREYAREVSRNSSGVQIDVLDGERLRDVAGDVGLDLYNGSIEIVCNELLRPSDPTQSLFAPVSEAFDSVENVDTDMVGEPSAHVVLEPYVRLSASVDSVFETSVGVVHVVDEESVVLVSGEGEGEEPVVVDGEVAALVRENFDSSQRFERDELEELFGAVELEHFALSETGYKEWLVDDLRERFTSEVEYTGDNNVTYNKVCEPKVSDVSVSGIDPVYAPRIRTVSYVGEYEYELEYYAAGPSRVTITNDIEACVHCSEGEELVFCRNCGSVNCSSHIRTERVTGEPVCTGCAVTERVLLSQKYFFDAENRDAFLDEYEQMGIGEKAMESPAVVGGVAVVMCVVMVLFAMGVL